MNRKRLLPTLLTLFLLGFAVLSSCTVKQQVTIRTDFSGTVTMRIDLAPAFVQYIKDLGEITGENFEDGYFNIEEIKQGFAENPGVQLRDISSPQPESLEMTVQ